MTFLRSVNKLKTRSFSLQNFGGNTCSKLSSCKLSSIQEFIEIALLGDRLESSGTIHIGGVLRDGINGDIWYLGSI